jgi:hypothetical protein
MQSTAPNSPSRVSKAGDKDGPPSDEDWPAAAIVSPHTSLQFAISPRTTFYPGLTRLETYLFCDLSRIDSLTEDSEFYGISVPIHEE